VLVFIPNDRLDEDLSIWKQLEQDFPETKFFYYPDTENVLRLTRIFQYIPLLRPYCLREHFKAFPELSSDAIFYIDSDVLLHKGVEFLQPFLQDDVVYMSDGKSYNNSEYFDSKIKDVLPHRLEDYKKIDVLNEAAHLCRIDRTVCEQNKNNTGAAQYLLKGVDSKFFDDLLSACCTMKLYLGNINRKYFESEEKGFQSWCADIFCMNFLLWHRGFTTATPSELDFAWATDSSDRWHHMNIYHDAGANGGEMFLKRKTEYVNNISTPFQDNLSFVSDKYCYWHYVQEINATKSTFNL
jgi:hypothetical protein